MSDEALAVGQEKEMVEVEDIRIDPEFRSLVPALTEDERQQLEENLKADGCRDPLVVWRGHGILLDGHNRYNICRQHGIPHETVEVDLPDRDAAKVWIIMNQLGRRNLNAYQRSELALALEPLIAARSRQGVRTDLCQNSDESHEPLDTKREVAQLAGVSHDSIGKAKFISGRADEATKETLRRGETSINAVYQTLRGRGRCGKTAKPTIPVENPATSEAEEPTTPSNTLVTVKASVGEVNTGLRRVVKEGMTFSDGYGILESLRNTLSYLRERLRKDRAYKLAWRFWQATGRNQKHSEMIEHEAVDADKMLRTEGVSYEDVRDLIDCIKRARSQWSFRRPDDAALKEILRSIESMKDIHANYSKLMELRAAEKKSREEQSAASETASATA